MDPIKSNLIAFIIHDQRDFSIIHYKHGMVLITCAMNYTHRKKKSF